MESQALRIIYCLDTSSLVTIQRTYPAGVFPGLWESLAGLAREGRLAAPREVFNELEKGGDDDIHRWAKKHRFIFRDLVPEQADVAGQIVNDEQFRGLVDHSKEIPEADPFVIALAVVEQRRGRLMSEHWVVVADEGLQPPPNKPRIPNVCKDSRFQVECIKTLDMFRREGWQFVKKAPGGSA